MCTVVILINWHMNRSADEAGEAVKVKSIYTCTTCMSEFKRPKSI